MVIEKNPKTMNKFPQYRAVHHMDSFTTSEASPFFYGRFFRYSQMSRVLESMLTLEKEDLSICISAYER
jgi:hypothetical protein